MINLLIKPVAKERGIKDNENKSGDDLMKILSESKTKISLCKKKIKDIKEKFCESRYKFSKSKIN